MEVCRLAVTGWERCFREEDKAEYASGLLKHTPFVVIFLLSNRVVGEMEKEECVCVF